MAQLRLPRPAAPARISADYYRALDPVLRALKVELDRFVRELEVLWPQDKRADASGDPIQRLLDETARRLGRLGPTHESLKKLTLKYGQQTADLQKRQLLNQARAAVGVDLLTAKGLDAGIAAAVSDFAVENVKLVQSLGPRLSGDLAKLVSRATLSGSRWETIARELVERGTVTEDRAKLIARDQVGKLYGQVNGQRQQNLGVTTYVWRTVRDNRVREDHEDREGESFAWADPPDDGHPGEAINCRCYAEPDFSDLGLV